MQARPHQVKAKLSARADYDAGHHHLLLSMATGTGKTYTVADMYEEFKDVLPGKMLVVVHTEELVDQIIETFREKYPTLRIDKEMAEHKADPSQADIIVASVKSLGRAGTSRVTKYNWDEWDKIWVDEAHHIPASSYRNVLDAAGCMRSDSAKLLIGTTATSKRADGKALGEFFGRISYSYGLEQAIKDGWLVDVKGYRVDTTTDLDSVATDAGDFNKVELEDKVNNDGRNKRIVEAWMKLSEFRQTVVFCAGVDHAKALAATFKEFGVDAEAVWGDDPDRAQKMKDHKSGKTKVICNFGVLVEGYDDPNISCVVHARPTENESLYQQMTGRGTRLDPKTGNLKEWLAACRAEKVDPLVDADGFKTDCIIIDVVDNTDKHSLMTLPSLLGLPAGMDLKGRSAVEAKDELDAKQEAFPQIDFSTLAEMSAVDQFIQEVNLFEIRFPTEVEQNSDLKWYKTVDGKYRMQIPGPAINKAGEPIMRAKGGSVTIGKNILNKWEIDGTIKDSVFHGIRNTFEEAIAAADRAVTERAGAIMTLLNRKGSWQEKPMELNGGQHKLLQRLYGKAKQWPADMTKGQASFWIDKKLKRKG
jgi:superfamily II DNA or RNA helicase